MKRVLTKVDFPSPDSPIILSHCCLPILMWTLTNYHNVEVEPFTDTLAVPLVRQIGEAHVSCELPSNNIPHVTSRLCRGLGVFGADSLRGDLLGGAHRVGALVVR